MTLQTGAFTTENDVSAAPTNREEFDVSVIAIASNEHVDAELFVSMIDSIREVAHRENLRTEIIVVDDGIGGDFWRCIQILSQRVPNFRALRFRRTFGESVAVRIAVGYSRAPLVVTTTWYLQVAPDALIEVVKTLRNGADFVATRRTKRVDSAVARLQSWAFNRVTTRVTGVQLHDLNCSFRGFKRSIIDRINFHGDLFRFIPILAVSQGFRVEEVPVAHLAERGPSTFLNISLYLRRFLDIFGLFFLMKFTKKPLRFFGLSGFAMFMAGALIAAFAAVRKIVNDIGVLDRPELVLALFLMVLGPIVLSIGLIGEIIIFTQGAQTSDYCVDEVVEHDTRTSSRKDGEKLGAGR